MGFSYKYFDRRMSSVPEKIRWVPQAHTDGCGIACAAMITSTPYDEAWRILAPPPGNEKDAPAYNQRELKFFEEEGWWPAAQLVLKTIVALNSLNWITESEDTFKEVVTSCQRIRVILTFFDGTKPDHAVVWDRQFEDVVFDPARGIIPTSKLFDYAGPQSYSGSLGFTAYRYQPGQSIQTLIKTETGL